VKLETSTTKYTVLNQRFKFSFQTCIYVFSNDFFPKIIICFWNKSLLNLSDQKHEIKLFSDNFGKTSFEAVIAMNKNIWKVTFKVKINIWEKIKIDHCLWPQKWE